MKQPRLRLPQLPITAVFIFVIVVLVTGAFFVYHARTETKPLSKSIAVKMIQSQFSFTGAPGWHQGPTNETSMALSKDDHECFTSIEHKPGIVDVATDIQKQQTMMASSGSTMTGTTTTAISVQTSTGPQQYQLHEFSLSSGDVSHPLMGGLGLGYVQLSNSYLYIQSHCNNADELPTTVPALQSYSFSESK